MTIPDGWTVDLSPAEWVLEGWERGHSVTQVVPRGFDAYLRILHPARIMRDDNSFIAVSWAAVAAWSGLRLHRRADWASITIGPEPLPPEDPFTYAPNSMLTSEQNDALVEILAAHDSSDRVLCWTLGALPDPVSRLGDPLDVLPPDPVSPADRNAAKVEAINGFEYLLFRLPLPQALKAAFCWPDDRSWFVGGSGDLAWTYLGGSTDLIGRVDADDRLETKVVDVDEPIGYVEPWLEDAARVTARQIVATGHGTITTSQGTTYYSIVPTTNPDVSYLREGTADYEHALGVIGAAGINEDDLTDHITSRIVY